MNTGAGVTGWSTANIDERTHYERFNRDHYDIDRFYESKRESLAESNPLRFMFLYKNGSSIGGVIGSREYVLELHKRMLRRDVPTTLRIIRGTKAA